MRAFGCNVMIAASIAAAAATTILPDHLAYAQDKGATREIIITVQRVRALDKLDLFSKADFFARVTIAGKAVDSPVAKQADDIRPNWVIKHSVPPGVHDVRLEIFDKDLKSAELIDVNRVDGRRHLEFTVNTRSCRIGGFASGYRCRQAIRRAGAERKKAEVTFTVDVRR